MVVLLLLTGAGFPRPAAAETLVPVESRKAVISLEPLPAANVDTLVDEPAEPDFADGATFVRSDGTVRTVPVSGPVLIPSQPAMLIGGSTMLLIVPLMRRFGRRRAAG